MSSKKRQSQLFVTLNGKDREERMGTNWSLKAGERLGKGGQTTLFFFIRIYFIRISRLKFAKYTNERSKMKTLSVRRTVFGGNFSSGLMQRKQLNIQTSLLLALIRTLANVKNPTVRIPKVYML